MAAVQPVRGAGRPRGITVTPIIFIPAACTLSMIDLGAGLDLLGGESSGDVVGALEEDHVGRAVAVEHVTVHPFEGRGAIAAIQYAVARNAFVHDRFPVFLRSPGKALREHVAPALVQIGLHHQRVVTRAATPVGDRVAEQDDRPVGRFGFHVESGHPIERPLSRVERRDLGQRFEAGAGGIGGARSCRRVVDPQSDDVRADVGRQMPRRGLSESFWKARTLNSMASLYAPSPAGRVSPRLAVERGAGGWTRSLCRHCHRPTRQDKPRRR